MALGEFEENSSVVLGIFAPAILIHSGRGDGLDRLTDFRVRAADCAAGPHCVRSSYGLPITRRATYPGLGGRFRAGRARLGGSFAGARAGTNRANASPTGAASGGGAALSGIHRLRAGFDFFTRTAGPIFLLQSLV